MEGNVLQVKEEAGLSRNASGKSHGSGEPARMEPETLQARQRRFPLR